MFQRSNARHIIALYLTNMVLTVLALCGARWLRMTLPFGEVLRVDGAVLRWPMVVLAIVTWSVTLAAGGIYDPQRFSDPVEELQSTISGITAATLIYAGELYLSYRGLSRLLFLYFYLLDTISLVGVRLLWQRVLERYSATHPTSLLILGAGELGQQVARSLESQQQAGIEVVGYLDDDPIKRGQILASHQVLGTLDQAPEIIRERRVEEIIIALPHYSPSRLGELMASLQALPVNVRAVADYSQQVLSRASVEQRGDLLYIGLNQPVIGPIDRAIKRLFDIVVSSLCLILLAPVFGIISLAIAIGSPGPILYRSRRVGEGGKPFRMCKFRTMYRGADSAEGRLISETVGGRLSFGKRADDPRVTALGRFLRRYSLDELPQLANVWLGEMSLVGPRPELPAVAERYEAWQRRRFSVPQGITGWWQISGRSTKDKRLQVEDDLYYIRNYSLLLDLRILWRTLGAIIRGTGAF